MFVLPRKVILAMRLVLANSSLGQRVIWIFRQWLGSVELTPSWATKLPVDGVPRFRVFLGARDLSWLWCGIARTM